ncbi:MAG: hypothetical protein CVU09_03695 [Bacteroidetes bacterium HGW-Bacteroidetes-4]|nr:MAG: hypothetical protein CVU09_03695 [Bacteroidetes bacterium HGW-Bacteroidetes-4]
MAQIENEIRNFVDSTEILINNGRRLLIKSLEEDNPEKANQVYTYLINASGKDICRAFSYDEQMCLSLIFENYQAWIDHAINFRQLYATYNNSRDDNLYSFLRQYLIRMQPDLLQRINTTALTDEDKALIQLFLHLIIIDRADDTYNQMLKDFKRLYPQTRYAVFFSDYMPGVRVKAGSAFGMGVSGIFPTDNLATGFSSNVGFNMSWDFNINNIYTSLYMQAGALHVNTPFSMYNNFQTIDFDNSDSFSYIDGGLIMGYFVVRSKHLHLAPFGALMGTNLTSNLYTDPDDEKYEVKIVNTFSYGVGLKTELKLFEYDLHNFYGYGQTGKSYFSLKTEVGYNVLAKHNFEGFRGNIAYVRATLMWGFGNF